uniref:Uncharacterized protein n=1 Tax=Monopterus albus TaxID=43700 RepID=A0A3Q3IHQ0_MONAL
NAPPLCACALGNNEPLVPCSPHFLLSACEQEVTRSQVELSSDGVRGKIGVKTRLHVWEVLCNLDHRGSDATSGYDVLVGRDLQSWGWKLKTNQLWHGGRKSSTSTHGTLGFVVDGSFLGVPFKDHPRGVELFPVVSSVRGELIGSLSFSGDSPALMALCQLSIHQFLGQQRKNQWTKCLYPLFSSTIYFLVVHVHTHKDSVGMPWSL